MLSPDNNCLFKFSSLICFCFSCRALNNKKNIKFLTFWYYFKTKISDDYIFYILHIPQLQLLKTLWYIQLSSFILVHKIDRKNVLKYVSTSQVYLLPILCQFRLYRLHSTTEYGANSETLFFFWMSHHLKFVIDYKKHEI